MDCIMMPAGVYYVGDLCYVMKDEEWDQFLDLTIKGSHLLDGEFQFPDGRRFATYGTAWGDGVYHDQHGHEYSVDAGLIGCILLSDIRAAKYENIQELGNIVEFTEDFETSGCLKGRNSDGVISIGPLRIDTDPSDYDSDGSGY
jgi:hypothetical protein